MTQSDPREAPALRTLEAKMNTRRWLVPFTWAMDMQAIDAIIYLAQGGRATLVAVSLISRPDKPGSRGPRLEHIQQSKDFLEATKRKADRLDVPLDRHEVFTVDAMQSISTLTHELHCDAIVLVSRGEREALLRAHQLKGLLEHPPASLLVLRLASRSGQQSQVNGGLIARMLSGLRLRGSASGAPDWDIPVSEGPLWIRTEERRRD